MSSLGDAMALAERSTRLTHSVTLGKALVGGYIMAFAVHFVEIIVCLEYMWMCGSSISD